jgi:fimbrial isopeptide formation D2 family protein
MMFSQFPRSLVMYFLLCLTVTLAQTSGGTVISNQASASYTVLGLDSSGTSNKVESNVPSFCTFAVTPNGSVASPARTIDAIPGVTVYFPYTLEYTGNIITAIDLTALVETSSTFLPTNVSIILDSNSNQRFDTGESEINSLTNIALGSSTALLLAVTLESSYPRGGTIDVNLRAHCKGETIFDEDNISRVNVLRGGVTGLTKTSVPSPNSQVEPGDTITYSISFTVNQITLNDAVINDVLDDALSAPTALNLTVNNAPRSGIVYSNSTQTVTATLGQLNPSDVVSLTISTTVLAGTPGAVTIDNQATLNFTGGSLNTNTVTHVTPATCTVVIKADGSLGKPAFTENALPGDTVVYPYTLTNLGNVTNDFALETTLSNNSFTPNVLLVLDANNNSVLDSGETAIIQINDLPKNETVNLLLVIAVPNDLQINGDAFINIIGRCSSEPAISDDNNISRISVPNGGITTLQKSAQPVAGSILYPSADLHYFIDFEANGRDLTNVVVSDVLDERLVAPSSFTNGEIRDAESGLTTTVLGNYDASSRKLTWNLATVPARMKVRLELVTSVKANLQPQTSDTINNTATFSSSDIPETFTNTVTHPLNKLEILLSKVATPEKVFVGDTLHYTLTIVNPQESITLRELVLTDTLPDELRYQTGTARVKLPGTEEQELEPTIEGQKLTWTLPGIKPSEQIVVTIGTDVLATATRVGELLNTASLVASDVNGRAVAAAAASAAAVVDKGVFAAPAVLLGTVFEDVNKNTVYDDDADIPVSGVRLYLSDGRSVLSDDLGRYTFLELRPGIDAVKVDTTTLGSRLLEETTSEVQPGLWRVRLEQGLITRQDVSLLPPGASIAVSQVLNIVMGSVHVQKSVVVTDAATRVILKVTSSESLRGLVVRDVLPEGITLASDSTMLDELTFDLGDISANVQTTLEYTVQPENINPADLLLAPTISWQVRP